MKCRLCQNETQYIRTMLFRNKYTSSLELCPVCKLLQVENPFWLGEAYSSPINLTDTGILQRNNNFCKRVSPILYHCFNKNAKFLDYAGGYGIFTRLMRDVGFDYYWQDKYAENIFSKGFEHVNGARYEVVTLFEYMEHVKNPLDDLRQIFEMTENIIFSTNLYGEQIPDSDWWYYGVEHGQHIAFYSKETLYYIADKLEKKMITDGFLHALISPSVNSKLLEDVFIHNIISGKEAWNILSSKKKLYKLVPYLLGTLRLDPSIYVNMISRTFSDHTKLKYDEVKS